MAGSKLAALAAESGVSPLEFRYTPIIGTYTQSPVAYRTRTVVYSMDLGTLTQSDYTYAVDIGNETGLRLSEWNIAQAVSHVRRLGEAGQAVSFVTARCTASFANTSDAFDRVKKLIDRGGLEDPSGLCLEFPQSILYLGNENARKTVMDMKLLGVRTLLSGCGAGDCPVSRLMDIPLDMVLLDADTVSLVHNRNKPDVLRKLCQYLKSMDLTLYGEGVENDEDFRELLHMDLQGVTLAEHYEGRIERTESDVTLDELLDAREVDA